MLRLAVLPVVLGVAGCGLLLDPALSRHHDAGDRGMDAGVLDPRDTGASCMGLRDSGLLDASVPLDAAAADGGGGPDAPTYLVDGGPDAAVRDDGGWDSGLGMMVPCETNAECDASEYC
ncbi:MAG: hypothetical protein ACK6CU_11525, partial [Deltaproteobacteria bacterium]